MEWDTVIGLEVHVQLATQTKIFDGDNTAYGALPNTQANMLATAQPGTLPVLNKEAVAMAIKLGLAINAEIAPYSVFARKNYFYPDLPKGYQISQFEHPVVLKGSLTIQLDEQTTKTIRITRAHLEEDAGKSIHEGFANYTGIDLNRAGIPLLEIVSEPDMCCADEAVKYLKTLHNLVRYLGICDGNMQEGSFRCDANISVKPKGSTQLGTRAEIKNINSFRFVERAIEFEVERQINILENGGTVLQETRLFQADKNETRSMRSKEDAHDYRYFPDPDLLPLKIEASWIDAIKKTLPELPDTKRQRFIRDYQLSNYDAFFLANTREISDYFEQTIQQSKAAPKLIANWMMGDLSAAINKNNLEWEQSPIQAEQLAQLLDRIEDQTISGKIAKQVFELMWQTRKSADMIIEQEGLKQVTDSSEIEKLIDDVLQTNSDKVLEYQSGKEKLFGFFVGQIMKLSQGKANPDKVNQLLMKKLKSA